VIDIHINNQGQHMKRETIFGAFAAFALAIISFMVPSSAQATVTCNSYHSLYPAEQSRWPNDWTATSPGHYYICSPTITSAEAIKVFNVPAGTIAASNRTLLSSKGMTYFFFANRDDAISYMKSDPKYSGNANFANATSRCGQTAYTPGSGALATEIYKTCQLASTTIPNPSLYNVTLHETGHAYDYALALASTHPGIPMSHTAAFKKLFNNVGHDTPTAASDEYFLNNGRQSQLAPATCTLFGSAQESALELDLGAPTAIGGPVCTNGVRNSQWLGYNNTAITHKQDPYFVNTPVADAYGELWAALYVAKIGVQSPDILPFLDNYILAHRCVSRAMDYLIPIQAPPPDAQFQNLECPVPTASQW
jgi:hypothetical protein